MPQETKSAQDRATEEAYQGLTATRDDPTALHKALELAVDYRGDITMECDGDGDEPRTVEGFAFDLKESDPPAIRLIPKGEDTRTSVPIPSIRAVRFTGKDTAAGKTFEAWMKRYVEKKLAGERASIEAETLEE